LFESDPPEKETDDEGVRAADRRMARRGRNPDATSDADLREAKIERLGEFIVFSSVGEPAEMPDSISIIGGAPDGEPQPMHYFDSRGVKRLFLMTLDGSAWKIWRAPGEDWNGPDGPGFNQRFIGVISADGRTIKGRWERGMGDAANKWEIDFPINYVRKQRT
jgi:hypothetical protein